MTEKPTKTLIQEERMTEKPTKTLPFQTQDAEIAAPEPVALVPARKGPPVPVVAGSLAMKLSRCMADIETVEKRGRNEFHKYDYATEADISRAVRKAMIAHGVIIVPRVSGLNWYARPTAKGGTDQAAEIHMTFTIMDTQGPEVFEVPWVGMGQDSGEKGLYKAMTGAVKYFLSKLFLIATGDDPEQDSPEQRQQKTQGRPMPRPAAPAVAPQTGGAPTLGEAERTLVRGMAKPRGFRYGTTDDTADVRNLRNLLFDLGGVRDLKSFPLAKLDELCAKLNDFDVVVEVVEEDGK